MECTQSTWLSDREYLHRFSERIATLRIPLSGSIDLTHRCNLRCVHCYLGEKTDHRHRSHRELSTAQWINIIDEITDAGCLYLLITGGEPLLREDFPDIYTRAKENGLIVTVFTNGTVITENIIALFEDLPPHVVEITLYGATAETYEKITGVKGSYEKCIKGIQKLLNRSIHFRLKTILMTHNRHEFFDIKNIAEEYNVKFRFDTAIFPTFDGDKAPTDLRVTAQEAFEKEFSDRKTLRQWQDYYNRRKGVPASDALYHCGTGLTGFHIDPYGNLQPCLMVKSIQYNLLKGSFMTGWQNVIPGIRMKKAGRNFPCNHCEKMALCGFCPAFFELENQREDVPSEYLCAMGQYRFEAINDTDVPEDNNADR